MKTTAKKATTKIPATAVPVQEAATVANAPKKATRPARKAKAAKPAKVAKQAGSTKKDQVLALISRAKGATLDEIMSTMNWQRHTVRGFISILNKAGAKIESTKSEKGLRTYRAA